MRTHLIAMLCAIASTAQADTRKPTELDRVFFAFDSARVEGAVAKIERIARYANDHSEMTLVIDGHADAQGPSPYNVALAARRADGIKRKLVANGVDPDRIVIVTYGEDSPSGSTYARDRRVEVWATDAPLYAIIARSFGRATAVLWNRSVEATALVAPKTEKVSIR